jgi:hypothetical protein
MRCAARVKNLSPEKKPGGKKIASSFRAFVIAVKWPFFFARAASLQNA